MYVVADLTHARAWAQPHNSRPPAHTHQVMPFGSLLDIPAVNMFVFRKFKGGTASVLRYIPMLRSCMQAYRCAVAMQKREIVTSVALQVPRV